MKLYHFTVIENLFLISMRGLEPRIHRAGTSEDAACMTMGQPAVWLTRQKSNLATDTDIARLRMQGMLDFKVGDFMFGGDQRLTVKIERHNKRLMRYADFLRTTDIAVAHPDNPETFRTGRDVLNSGTLSQSALNDWWVYFGTIAPHKIELALTAALALPGIEHQIATHPDIDARARFKTLRDQVAMMAPDQLV